MFDRTAKGYINLRGAIRHLATVVHDTTGSKEVGTFAFTSKFMSG